MNVILYGKTSHSVADLQEVAEELAAFFTFPSVVLFQGPLGAGKTTLISSLVHVFGAPDSEEVASPTFALHHAYQTKSGPIDHWDLYRLETEDELESSGFWDQFAKLESLVFIEWPERLQKKWLPKTSPLFELEITIEPSGARTITLRGL